MVRCWWLRVSCLLLRVKKLRVGVIMVNVWLKWGAVRCYGVVNMGGIYRGESQEGETGGGMA